MLVVHAMLLLVPTVGDAASDPLCVQHIMQHANVNVTEPQSIQACHNMEKDFYNFVLRVHRKNSRRNIRPNIPVATAATQGFVGNEGGSKRRKVNSSSSEFNFFDKVCAHVGMCMEMTHVW